jgi:PAS domain S-box-containing protein
VTRDLTQRHATEEALRQSEERFRLLVESVVDYAIYMLDVNGYVVSWNAGAERMKGYRAEEIIGKHFSRFYPEESIRAGKPQHELEVAAREGRAEDEGWRVRKDGTPFWVNAVVTALRDANGELLGFAKVTRDLTERRRTEEFRDRFVANAAHEIRTPLTTVKGFAETLRQREMLPPEEMDEVIAALNRGVDRLTLMVQNLLDLTRLERASLAITPQRTTAGRAIRDALDRAPVPASKNLVIDGDMETRLYVDPARLGDVVTNLLVNAYRYGGDNIRIEIVPNGSRTEVVVADDGPGVPSKIASRIFEPFVRGENVGGVSGSGLGLSIVYAMAEAMDGEVRYEPNVPSGARFTISVPNAAPP